MADVVLQRSSTGAVIGMLRHETLPDGSHSVEIDCGGPDTAGIVMDREDARRLGVALLAGYLAAEPGANGEAAARGGYIHLIPEIVNARLAAAMMQGL